jgi:hypothetical protein
MAPHCGEEGRSACRIGDGRSQGSDGGWTSPGPTARYGDRRLGDRAGDIGWEPFELLAHLKRQPLQVCLEGDARPQQEAAASVASEWQPLTLDCRGYVLGGGQHTLAHGRGDRANDVGQESFELLTHLRC